MGKRRRIVENGLRLAFLAVLASLCCGAKFTGSTGQRQVGGAIGLTFNIVPTTAMTVEEQEDGSVRYAMTFTGQPGMVNESGIISPKKESQTIAIAGRGIVHVPGRLFDDRDQIQETERALALAYYR